MKNKIAMLMLVAVTFMSTALFGYNAVAFTNDVNAGLYNRIPVFWLATNSIAATYADNVFAQADASIITVPVGEALKSFSQRHHVVFGKQFLLSFHVTAQWSLALWKSQKKLVKNTSNMQWNA